MTFETVREIRHLFEALMERGPEEREAFLRHACGHDAQLGNELHGLLAEFEKRAANPPGQVERSVSTFHVHRTSLPVRLEGRRIGDCEIVRQLGNRGGFLTFLAVRRSNEQTQLVVTKIVDPESDPPGLLALEAQAETLLRLQHTNIAHIVELGVTDWTCLYTCCPEHRDWADEVALPYLVMEYVSGLPIDTYCNRARMDVNERLKLFLDVCGAVQYVHESGTVNTKINSRNILVMAGDVVKLCDFVPKGLAFPSFCAERRGPKPRDLLLMAPEFWKSRHRRFAATPATDIYDLGVLLYGLLTGWPAYGFRGAPLRPSEAVEAICDPEISYAN
jgi:serine/threonine protein kinase